MRIAPVLALAACSVPDLDLTGKLCPCPSGYVCDTARNMCARSLPADARGGNDSGDGSTGDGASGSCLTAPFTHPAYSTATFGDFSTAWMTTGGLWMATGPELTQTSTVASLSVAYTSPPGAPADVRVVSTMHATSTGAGDAIEVSLRIDAADVHMYHCNWQPSDGGFLIQRTDSITMGHVIQMTTVDISSLPGYSPSDPQVLEFQVNGSQFECCMHGIAAAHLSGTDTTYTTGAVGVKTYDMSGGFRDFSVYTP